MVTSKTFIYKNEFDAAIKTLMETEMNDLWNKWITTCAESDSDEITSKIELVDIEGILVIIFTVIGLAIFLTLCRVAIKKIVQKYKN